MNGPCRFRPLLSVFLDGELAAGDAGAVDAHLRECAACRTLLAELDAVRTRARTLEARPPGRDLWPGIREALEAPTVIRLADHRGSAGSGRPAARPRRGIFLSLRHLGAAAVVMATLLGAGTWVFLEGRPAPAGAADPDAVEALRPEAAWTGDRRFTAHAAEIAELREILRRGRARLDPNTVRILEKNLALIDGAIRESAEALAVDPGNPFVEEHLRRSFDRKVTYLREAAALLEMTD